MTTYGLAVILLMQTATTQPAPATRPSGVAALRQEAAAALPLVRSDLARNFLNATAALPPPAERKLFRDTRKQYVSPAAATTMPVAERDALIPVPVTETLYYNTKYGTPLAYVRALDVLAEADLRDLSGKRILDYGYGTVGHLRLMAALGADAVGVDVDPFLPALYSDPSDQGAVNGLHGRDGRVTMIHGRWPGEPAAKSAVGGGYDVITSKNTLKMGYLHPASPVDPRMLVDLGVAEEAFVRALHAALKPGGLLLIYNICPKLTPPGEGYRPWSDGRCPFPRESLERCGFEVLKFDEDDSDTLRRLADAFGWDEGAGAMDLQNDLFAHYTLLRRRP